MAGSSSNFGGSPPNASNGIGLNGTTNEYELGGNLTRPTLINTSAANPLGLTGLVNGDPATDSIMVVDANGFIRFVDAVAMPDFWRAGIGDQAPNGVTDHTDAITHDGNVGLGITSAAQVAARLDVNGAQILRPVAIANLAAGGAVGTAAATVDITSTLVLAQTTANQALTIPAPTNAQAGRLLYVTHNGTAAGTTVGGKVIAPGETLLFVWDGNSWNGIAAPVVADFWRSGAGATLPDGATDTTDAITHDGNVGVGIPNPTTLTARLDVNGAQVLRPAAIANLAAAGAVGTAAATVDIASTLVLAQTTANVALTLPNPTNAQTGRLLFVTHNGTATGTTVGGKAIAPAETLLFVWDGNSWNGIAYPVSVDFWRSGVGATLPDGTTDTTDVITHDGNVGIGLPSAATVTARLDVNGAEVLRPVALGNFAANAVIGTAAATVDIASMISIAQATQNITLTLPNPTNAQAGRLLIIYNTGLAAFSLGTTAGNQKVWPGANITLTWNGAGWVPPKLAPLIVPITFGANLTLEPVRHHFEILECTAAGNITVTVPTTLPVGFQVSITQAGAGRITFVGSGGMVVVNRWAATQSAGQWAKVGIEIRAANSCVLSGDVV